MTTRFQSSPVQSRWRDHLFISYAYEDEALAEWLALRLTAEGYKVWIDRFKLLGGESYPRDIDKAIKDRTFRLLALLSHDSLFKPNPLKERTLALNLQRQRQDELVITLNVSNLRPDEIDWMTSDLTYIPFWDSWATGLAQLLEKLASVDAPREVRNGRRIAADAYLPADIVLEKPEPLYANLLTVERMPPAIASYTTTRQLSRIEENDLAREWAFWSLSRKGTWSSRKFYFSFDEPPRSTLARCGWLRKVVAAWRDVETICEIKTTHIVKPLIRRTLLHYLRTRGLRAIPDDPHILYFPQGLLPNDTVSFRRPDGKMSYRRVVGERAWPRGERFAYHQALTFDIRTDLSMEFVAQFRIRIHITDCSGKPLSTAIANSRRKLLTRTWYNEEWLARHLALAAFLSDGRDIIETSGTGSLALSSSLLELMAPSRIDEGAIPKGIPIFKSANPGGKDG